MGAVDSSTLAALPLDEIERVTFYKRDELTTDLICCDVALGGSHRTFHEEMEGWDLLVSHFEQLPGFRQDWHASVVRPPFEPCETIAFRRGN